MREIWIGAVADLGFLKEREGGEGMADQNDIGTMKDKIVSVIALFPFIISSFK